MAVDDGDLVQPDEEGQGDEPTQDSPYAEYVNRFPEDVRSDAEAIFKEWDGNVTRMRQSDAEYRQQFEPLEHVIAGRDPEQVQWGLQFVDALDDPSAIQAWFDNYARENGLTPQQQQQLQDDSFDSYVDPNVEQVVEQRLNQYLGPVAQQLGELAEWRTEQEQQYLEAQAMGQIEQELSDLAEKHPKEFDRDMVEMFVANHMDDPEHAVSLAFQDCQRVVNQIQRDTLQSKVRQPPAAESGGSANGTAEPPPRGEAMKHAALQALEQLRQSNNA